MHLSHGRTFCLNMTYSSYDPRLLARPPTPCAAPYSLYGLLLLVRHHDIANPSFSLQKLESDDTAGSADASKFLSQEEKQLIFKEKCLARKKKRDADPTGNSSEPTV